MPKTATEPTVRDRLEAQRLTLIEDFEARTDTHADELAAWNVRQNSDEFKALDEAAQTEERDAFQTVADEFKALSEKFDADLADFDANIRRRELVEQRLNEAAAASSRSTSATVVVSEPLTYRRDNARGWDSISYYADLALVLDPQIQLSTRGTRDKAQERLIRHAREMEVEMPKRAKAREERARKQFEAAEEAEWDKRGLRWHGMEFDPFEQSRRSRNPFGQEQRVEPNLTQGQGGYFVPPVWLVDEYIPGLRAHRIVANLPRQMDLPPGTDSINIPKLNTLTAVGYQQVNNSGLPSQDFTDTSVQANVKTVGGYTDVGLQLLELSPGAIVDEVITRDLMAAHDKFVDGEIIAGDGTNAGTLNGGHLLGIYNGNGGGNWSGTNTVTYTDGAPTAPHFLFGALGPMASKIAVNRFDASNFKIAVHGSRWFWYSNSPDVNGRPLGETAAGGPWNIAAQIDSPLQAEGLVGSLPSIANAPVYVDDNIPTADTTGGGSGQDVAIAGLWDDSWLFEGPLRTDVFREVLSSSLGVRFRIYGYKAFLIRYGQSFAVATGSGFARPSTGYGDYYR